MEGRKKSKETAINKLADSLESSQMAGVRWQQWELLWWRLVGLVSMKYEVFLIAPGLSAPLLTDTGYSQFCTGSQSDKEHSHINHDSCCSSTLWLMPELQEQDHTSSIAH